MPDCDLPFILSLCVQPTVVLDAEQTLVAINDAATDKGFAPGAPLETFCVINPGARAILRKCRVSTNRKRFNTSLADGTEVEAIGWRLGGPFRSDGLVILKLLDVASARSHFIVTANDVRHQRRSQRLLSLNDTLAADVERLDRLASRDELTGLLNARAFREAMDARIADDAAFALIYLDLNRLKLINDTLGHRAGDIAITEMAQAIMDSIRGEDVAARLGGDEFAILAAGPLSTVGMASLIARIGDRLDNAAQNATLDPKLKYSAAAGIACWPQDTALASDLEDLADRAMYRSKAKRLAMVFARTLDLDQSYGEPAFHFPATKARSAR